MSESASTTAHAGAAGVAAERPPASVASGAVQDSVAGHVVASVPSPQPMSSGQEAAEPASPTSSSDQPAPVTGGNAAAASANANRKRVFTFQKRWLHSLPIMEKVLSDNALDAASVAALKAANLLDGDGKPVDDAAARDVIVCMLCDDPNSTRDMLKIWSRLNCRRGRIENHLMSKHPEFMLLLKQKRETDGDLAVQIFLQDMREGRCNVRNEISAGLYSHMQPQSDASSHGHAVHHKRAFGHEDFMMPAAATAAAVAGSAYQMKPLETASSHKDGDVEDGESRRKRAKPLSSAGRDGSGMSTPVVEAQTQGEAEQQCDATLRSSLLHASLLSYHGPAAFTQWRSILTNRMIVITGGENAAVARAATNLWLLGANILITFAELSTMEAFATSYLGQFHSMEGVEPPRGVMLPLFCSLQTHPQIDEWSRSIAAKFEHVDLLINYVDQTNDNIVAANETTPVAKRAGDEPLTATKSRSQTICEVFTATCMQRSRHGAVINMNTPTDARSSTVAETMTTTLASELHASNVQVNCIVVEPAVADLSAQQSADQDLSLLHSILFLLSPASTSISGSVLRQRRSHVTPSSTNVDSPPVTVAALTPATTAIDTNAASTLQPQPQDAAEGSNGRGSSPLEHQLI